VEEQAHGDDGEDQGALHGASILQAVSIFNIVRVARRRRLGSDRPAGYADVIVQAHRTWPWWFAQVLVVIATGCRAPATPIAAVDRIATSDTRLAIELRGRGDDVPILLYLHGGPGSALGVVALRAYVGLELEARYLVAYLDQRGVLDSPAVPGDSQTIANHVADVQAAIRYLRARFPHRRLYLLGHSWGGTLALATALDSAGLVDGVIDVAGPFELAGTLRASYDTTLKWARDAHLDDAVAELQTVGPPPYRELTQQLTLSKWASSAFGGIAEHLSEPRLLSRAPYTKAEPAWGEAELAIVQAMYAELTRADLVPRLAAARTPLLVIVGGLDANVPPDAMQAGYQAYGGPKRWLALPRSHHLMFVDEPGAFVQAVEGFAR
jgi:pimeloyl-ACP methyl ester carboxylesterase